MLRQVQEPLVPARGVGAVRDCQAGRHDLHQEGREADREGPVRHDPALEDSAGEGRQPQAG